MANGNIALPKKEKAPAHDKKWAGAGAVKPLQGLLGLS